MKNLLLTAIVFFGSFFPAKVTAQAQEMQQLILNIEKLAQFREILSDMKKGYEILSGGYNTVKGLTKGNFDLHKTFLDALMQVSPAVRKCKRIGDIIRFQLLLVKEYKAALQRFRNSGRFTPDEIAYLAKVYDNLFRQSLRNLEELTTVVTANKLRMSDEERLSAIDSIYADMQDKLLFLRSFNNSTSVLAVQRAKEQQDVDVMKRIHQLNN
jgi:hypothetical protein